MPAQFIKMLRSVASLRETANNRSNNVSNLFSQIVPIIFFQILSRAQMNCLIKAFVTYQAALNNFRLNVQMDFALLKIDTALHQQPQLMNYLIVIILDRIMTLMFNFHVVMVVV